jgi:hypothetical protein
MKAAWLALQLADPVAKAANDAGSMQKGSFPWAQTTLRDKKAGRQAV